MNEWRWWRNEDLCPKRHILVKTESHLDVTLINSGNYARTEASCRGDDPNRKLPRGVMTYNEDFFMLKQLLAGSTLMGLLLFGGASTVRAQQGQPQPGQPQPQPGEMQQPRQMDVSESDLERFAVAIQQIQAIEQQAQAQMIEVIESQGLTIERFNEIAQSQQDPSMQGQVDVSGEEAEIFDQAVERISGIRQEAEMEMESAVQQEGLDVEEFNLISQAVQQDPSLQQRVMEMLGE